MRNLIMMLAIILSAYAKAQDPKRAEKAEAKHKPLLSFALSNVGLNIAKPMFFRILKEEMKLEVWLNKDTSFELFKSYEICYFSGGLGTKHRQGDGKSPEGFYSTTAGAMNAFSSYHLSFNTGYPNAYDRANGYTGSAIMIHGECVSIGCYAMGNDNIEEIWTLLKMNFAAGQSSVPIHIFPFAMSDANMEKHKTHPHYAFWKNLKAGYDFFEKYQRPPKVTVKEKKYIFT